LCQVPGVHSQIRCRRSHTNVVFHTLMSLFH